MIEGRKRNRTNYLTAPPLSLLTLLVSETVAIVKERENASQRMKEVKSGCLSGKREEANPMSPLSPIGAFLW